MNVGSTVKWVGRSARDRAEVVGHQLKDRALEKRLERANEVADKLRMENDMLRDEVSESRSEHKRILDLLERKLGDAAEIEIEHEKHSHKGRWLLFLMALGGGAYAWKRMRSSNGDGYGEWSGTTTSPTATETNASTL